MNIESKFENLELREKIFLYLIVLIVSVLIYIFYDRYLHSFSPSPIENRSPLPLSVNSNNIKIVEKSDVEILEYLNKNTRIKNLTITDINILKRDISLKLIGGFENQIEFLSLVESNFEIKSFDMSYNKNIELSLIIGKQYFKDKGDKKSLPPKLSNPFYLKNVVVIPHDIRVDAIIKDEVLVDNIWYKKNDIIKRYKLLNIFPNYIVLLDIQTQEKIIKDIYYE